MSLVTPEPTVRTGLQDRRATVAAKERSIFTFVDDGSLWLRQCPRCGSGGHCPSFVGGRCLLWNGTEEECAANWLTMLQDREAFLDSMLNCLNRMERWTYGENYAVPEVFRDRLEVLEVELVEIEARLARLEWVTTDPPGDDYGRNVDKYDIMAMSNAGSLRSKRESEYLLWYRLARLEYAIQGFDVDTTLASGPPHSLWRYEFGHTPPSYKHTRRPIDLHGAAQVTKSDKVNN